MFLKDKLSSISTANYNRLFCGLLLVVIIGNGLYLWNTFKPADDYAIYIYFAEAAERGRSSHLLFLPCPFVLQPKEKIAGTTRPNFDLPNNSNPITHFLLS